MGKILDFHKYNSGIFRSWGQTSGKNSGIFGFRVFFGFSVFFLVLGIFRVFIFNTGIPDSKYLNRSESKIDLKTMGILWVYNL